MIVEREFAEDRNVPPVRVIGTEAETSADLWERIVLTAEETKATDALRVIEPDIDRIAAGTQGFFVRMASSEQRIPLGSMGDGIRRMLNLAINLATAANGTLIVDEIDTGLHHSVMTRMWRLVVETARRLNVQVFATTHSDDCVRSLARLFEETPEYGAEVALHRVVRGATSTVLYTAEEIQAATAAHIEVRGTN
jgi:predicted ATPase